MFEDLSVRKVIHVFTSGMMTQIYNSPVLKEEKIMKLALTSFFLWNGYRIEDDYISRSLCVSTLAGVLIAKTTTIFQNSLIILLGMVLGSITYDNFRKSFFYRIRIIIISLPDTYWNSVCVRRGCPKLPSRTS